MKSFVIRFMAAILVFSAVIVSAQEAPPVAAEKAPLMTAYFVSAVLRKADTEVTIKLVQGLQFSMTSTGAEKALLDKISKDFSGYVVVTTLVSPISSLVAPVQTKTLRLNSV